MPGEHPYAEVTPHGRVAVLRLTRAERLNALGVEVTDHALAALADLEADPAVHAVVLSGAGRAFSAGGDLAEVAPRVADGDLWARLSLLRDVQPLVTALRRSRLPVVAAVSGAAYGAGWSAVLACDLVVAAEDARFRQVFVKRALVPDLGSAWMLPRTVGVLRAKELMMLAGVLEPEQALEWGLVNRVAADGAAAEALARELAGELADVPPAVMAMTKSLINRGQGTTLEDSLALEEHAQALALGSAENQAAMREFLERSERAEKGS